MQFIDLLLSFILFATAVVFIIRKKLRENIWIIVLALIFFPISLIRSYFPEMDVILFGKISVLDAIVFSFVKLILLLAILRYIFTAKGKKVLR